MCTGIALLESELPLDLLDRPGFARRIHSRGGAREVRFLFADHDRVLPVRHEGRWQIARWGNRRGEDRQLPCTGWLWQSTVAAGQWSQANAAAVTIPANFGLHNGIWYRILQGIRGLLVEDERGQLTTYMICQPASHYYQVMTRSAWMPVLIGERI